MRSALSSIVLNAGRSQPRAMAAQKPPCKLAAFLTVASHTIRPKRPTPEGAHLTPAPLATGQVPIPVAIPPSREHRTCRAGGRG
jgi:hypothetical protein